MRQFRAALLAAGVLAGSGLPPAAQGQVSSDLRDALNQLDPVVQSVVAQCTIGGEKFLFSAVKMPEVRQNPFTPQLVPPGGPSPGSTVGYYQFALYLSQQGHYISRMTTPALPVTDVDRLNGIDARFQVDMFAKAYRIYDVKTERWSDWTAAGSFGNDVHYASFTLQRRNGVWRIEGGFLINTNGKLVSADCASLPRL